MILTKDEVLSVDASAMRIGDYLALRGQLVDSSRENATRIALAMLALKNEAHAQGENLEFSDALKLARTAYGDLQDTTPTDSALRKRIEAILSRSVVQQNPQVLAELR